MLASVSAIAAVLLNGEARSAHQLRPVITCGPDPDSAADAFVRSINNTRPGFAAASGRLWHTDSWLNETCAGVQHIRELQATQPTKPRGAVTILAFQANCGEDCTRGNKHDQSWNVANMAAALDEYFFSRHGAYPLVIHHEDLTDEQRQRINVQTRSSAVVWQRVNFNFEAALPQYYDSAAVIADVNSSHRGGNLSSPSMRGTFHGFGYRTMCRFYSALVMFSPLLLQVDWYLRVDGGDSRINRAWPQDVFAYLQAKQYAYAYEGIAKAAENPRLDMALRRYEQAHPKVKVDAALRKPFVDAHGRYNGRYYYNNLEVVRLHAFRSRAHWSLFMAVEHSGAFMHGATHKQNLGDADFRSMALPYVLEARQVFKMPESMIPYQHPAPWDQPYRHQSHCVPELGATACAQGTSDKSAARAASKALRSTQHALRATQQRQGKPLLGPRHTHTPPHTHGPHAHIPTRTHGIPLPGFLKRPWGF